MTILFFNLSGGELLLILVVVLLLFGSKKIPELARGLGKGMRYLREASGEVQRELSKDLPEENQSAEGKEHTDSKRNNTKNGTVQHP